MSKNQTVSCNRWTELRLHIYQMKSYLLLRNVVLSEVSIFTFQKYTSIRSIDFYISKVHFYQK